MKSPDPLVSATIEEAVSGLLDLAATIAGAAAWSVEQFTELSAQRFADSQGEVITDCSITLVLTDKEPAN